MGKQVCISIKYNVSVCLSVCMYVYGDCLPDYVPMVDVEDKCSSSTTSHGQLLPHC